MARRSRRKRASNAVPIPATNASPLKKPGWTEIAGALAEVYLDMVDSWDSPLYLSNVSIDELLKRVNEKLVSLGYAPLRDPADVETFKRVVQEYVRKYFGEPAIIFRENEIPIYEYLYRNVLPREVIERVVEEAYREYQERLPRRIPILDLRELYPLIAEKLRRQGYPAPSLPTLFQVLKEIEVENLYRGTPYVSIGIPNFRGKSLPIPIMFHYFKYA